MSAFSGDSGPNPFGFDLSKGVHVGTVEQLNEFGQKFGPVMLQQVIDLNKGYMELAKSCVSMQYAYSRSVSTGSTGSAGSGAGVSGAAVGLRASGTGGAIGGASVGLSSSAGLFGARLDAIRRVKTWRSSVVPDGFCYTKVLRADVGSAMVAGIGAHPTLGSLMRLSRCDFVDLSSMKEFRLVSRGRNVYHMTSGGSEGVSAVSVMKSYVDRVSVLPGSVGELVKQSDVEPAVGVYPGRLRIGAARAWSGQRARQKRFMVCFLRDGEERQGSDEIQRRVKEFKDYAEYAPSCFDCIDFSEASDWAWVSSTAGEPSESDWAELRVALSGCFDGGLTPWGAVRVEYSK